MSENEIEGLIHRAEEYRDRGLYAEAMMELEKVLSLRPDSLRARRCLADIYRRQNEIDRSCAEYQSILSIDPEDSESRRMLQSLKEQEDTAPVYEIEDDVNGSDIGIEIPQKLAPVKEGNPSRELREFRKIMEEQSQDPSEEEESSQDTPRSPRGTPDTDRIVISMPTQTMADIYISQDLYERAMDIYREMLASDPENKKLLQRCEELKMLMKIKKQKSKRREE